MCLRGYFVVIGAMLLAMVAPAQQTTIGASPNARVVQATLIEPGSSPFHLRANITEKGDPTPKTQVEVFWTAPDKWRRTIRSEEFSQTLIVNGDRAFEQDSDDYFPLGLQTLVTAMVDPRPVLVAVRPGDALLTKANGASQESGVVCFGGNNKLCSTAPYGLREIVGAAGHAVTFTDYRDFKGKRVARLLFNNQGVGAPLMAQVTELKELKNPDESLFSIGDPTPKEYQIRSVLLPEAELRSLALEMLEIVWPQVLDGAITGTASFYISMDRTGQVREAIPVHTDNERSNDSAVRQMLKWKFKPVMKDGASVQAESILTFNLNTRAWGPASPLSDAEVRKLASNKVEPVIPPGTAPAGTTYTLRAAIDSEGNLIEVIGGGGAPKLFQPCYQAVSKWHFSPILEDGQPRPYRAEITFQVP
jgi:hypothetical protein